MSNPTSKYIDVPTSDILTRLKLGKTQFDNYTCVSTKVVINKGTNYFFPYPDMPFHKRAIFKDLKTSQVLVKSVCQSFQPSGHQLCQVRSVASYPGYFNCVTKIGESYHAESPPVSWCV